MPTPQQAAEIPPIPTPTVGDLLYGLLGWLHCTVPRSQEDTLLYVPKLLRWTVTHSPTVRPTWIDIVLCIARVALPWPATTTSLRGKSRCAYTRILTNLETKGSGQLMEDGMPAEGPAITVCGVLLHNESRD